MADQRLFPILIITLALALLAGCGESLRDAADVEAPKAEFVNCMEERYGPDHRKEWEGMHATHAEGTDFDTGFILTGHTFGCWEIEGAPRGWMRPR